MTSGNLALSPMEVLLRMSPLAFLQGALYSFLSGELSSLRTNLANPLYQPSSSPSTYFSHPIFTILTLPSFPLTLALLGNGILAFALNISSFSTNKYAGALTITVCGNVKQCITILLGILIFGVRVGGLNATGMLVALAGAAWFSVVELGSRERGKG